MISLLRLTLLLIVDGLMLRGESTRLFELLLFILLDDLARTDTQSLLGKVEVLRLSRLSSRIRGRFLVLRQNINIGLKPQCGIVKLS